MERTALNYQVSQLRDSIVALRSHLDDTLNRVDEFCSLVNRTADEARNVANTLGQPPTRGFAPLTLLGFLGLGAVAFWIVSPQTFSRYYDQIRGFVERESRRVGSTAREQFGGPGRTPS
jgi:hypothetical protein